MYACSIIHLVHKPITEEGSSELLKLLVYINQSIYINREHRAHWHLALIGPMQPQQQRKNG